MTAVHLPVIRFNRSCGECSVCCTAVQIKDLEKPARVPCRYLGTKGYECLIYTSPERPKVCADFICSWRAGAAREQDRPDLVGVMVTVSKVENGMFGLALEHKPGAVTGSGAHLVVSVATATKLPVIVSDYESLPPNDKGDRVAVHTSILYRSRRLTGRLITWLGPEVALYELIKGG